MTTTTKLPPLLSEAASVTGGERDPGHPVVSRPGHTLGFDLTAAASPRPDHVLVTCSCGCPLTHEWWQRERDAGRTRTQVCDGCDHDLELAKCPHCRSHRSIQIPTLRRGVLLAMMPTIATLNGVG